MAIRRGSARAWSSESCLLTIARYVFIACKHNLCMGDHPWLWGTTYGAVDSPGGPSMAAIVSPGGSIMATKFAVDGPGDRFWGDHRWRDRALA